LMTDAEMLILAQMQRLGECPMPWLINSEIGTLAGDGPPSGKLFRFQRYDVRLEAAWLKEQLGLTIAQKDIERYRCMDDPSIVHDIYQIAQVGGGGQVKVEHVLGKGLGAASG